MRGLAHLVACLLVAPQALLFAAIKLLGHVTRTGTLLGMLKTILDTLDALLGWYGLAAVAVALLLVVAGFSERWRPVASTCLLAADVYTGVVIITWMEVASVGDAVFFLAPGLIAAGICVSLIRRDMFLRRTTLLLRR